MTRGGLSAACALALAIVAVAAPAAIAQAPVESAAAGAAHPEIPDTEPETCRTCHDNLFAGEFVHGSAAGPTCAGCHRFDGAGDATRVGLQSDATRDHAVTLCAGCHKAVADAAAGPAAHAPVSTGDCLQCHSIHSPKSARLLVAPAPALCVTCHDTVEAELQRPVTHRPAVADCSMCHDPHAGGHKARLRAPINELCLECHLAPEQQPQRGQPSSIFGHRARRDTRALLEPSRRVLLDPLRRRGHPIGNHPVEGGKDPAANGASMTCTSCHAPHGSVLPALRRFGNDAMDFCTKCHK